MSEKGILYHFLPTEQIPPKEVWNRVEKMLDNDERIPFETLAQLEVEPPQAAWDFISISLDEDAFTNFPKLSFADTMLAVEKAPPTDAWANIEKKIGNPLIEKNKTSTTKIIRMVSIGLAAAACVGGLIFVGLDYFNGQPNQNAKQVAMVGKNETPISSTQKSTTYQPEDIATNRRVVAEQQKNKANVTALNLLPDNANALPNAVITEKEDGRNITLDKSKWQEPVTDINTTNNNVASNMRKIKNKDGDIIDRMSDYNTTGSGEFLAAIGPNGNSVRVSTKLANMIEFFKEDSTKRINEEYLDKVIRESNIWRKKLMDWKIKVDKADVKPSQMNFLDPIDLMKFLKENK